MAVDLSNEEMSELWLESGKDIHKYGRLIIVRVAHHEMFPGIVENTSSAQYDQANWEAPLG